jgi:hypothetical protein
MGRLPPDTEARKVRLRAMLDDFEAIYGVCLHGSTGRRKGKISLGRWHFVRSAYIDGFERKLIAEVLGVDYTTAYRLSLIEQMV